MPTIDYTVPDTAVTRDAEQAVEEYRAAPYTNPTTDRFAGHIDALLAELRDVRQAHAQSVENYHNLRTRVRDAIAADDYI
jgi:hypothetical protein